MQEQYLQLLEELPERKNGKIVGLYLCTKCGNKIKTLKTYVTTNKKTTCGCDYHER